MTRNINEILLGALSLIVSSMACNLPAKVESTPTPSEMPFYQQVSLISQDYEETGEAPNYTIKIHTPQLVGPEDMRLFTFNNQMSLIVQQELDFFKQSLELQPMQPVTVGSSLDVSFEQLSPLDKYPSLRIRVDYYSDGAAHPGSYYHSVTYDLEAGSFLDLGQLFAPGSDFLMVISDFCISELSQRDIAFDLTQIRGADPIMENYRNWNLTSDGLMITFDPYQVAAYAAGPQMVTIPYEELLSVADLQGPLASYLP